MVTKYGSHLNPEKVSSEAHILTLETLGIHEIIFCSQEKVTKEVSLFNNITFYLQAAMKNIYVLGGYSRHPGGRWSDSQSLSSVECFNSFTQVVYFCWPIIYSFVLFGVTVVFARARASLFLSLSPLPLSLSLCELFSLIDLSSVCFLFQNDLLFDSRPLVVVVSLCSPAAWQQCRCNGACVCHSGMAADPASASGSERSRRRGSGRLDLRGGRRKRLHDLRQCRGLRSSREKMAGACLLVRPTRLTETLQATHMSGRASFLQLSQACQKSSHLPSVSN